MLCKVIFKEVGEEKWSMEFKKWIEKKEKKYFVVFKKNTSLTKKVNVFS